MTFFRVQKIQKFAIKKSDKEKIRIGAKRFPIKNWYI